MAKLRVLVADDHAILRQGLRRLIEAEPDLTVVAEAADGAEALAQFNSHKPDLVVLDLSMPVMNGVEATRRMKAAHAACKILVLTVHEERGYLVEVLQAGAAGYMLLDDAAYDRVRNWQGGNPYKAQIAAMIAAGVEIEECGQTMRDMNWVNADLLPGVKVNSGANIRIIQLVQQGYVQIQP